MKQKLVPGSDNAKKIVQAMSASYQYNSAPYSLDVDLANFTKVLASLMLDGNLSAKASKLNLAIDTLV